MELRKKLISVAALAFTVALGAGMACMTASAETEAQTKDGFAVTAVSVRTENFKDADGNEITDSSGIRFKTDVPTGLEGEGYTKLTINGQSKEVNADVWRLDGSGWNTVVMGVPSTDYATAIMAQSFLVVSETEAYTTAAVTYSLVQAANEALKTETNAANKAVLNKYILDAVYALEEGATLDGTYTLTGVVKSVDEAYSSQYNNVTVTIVVDGNTEQAIKCYRLKGDDAAVINVGDTITVTGTLKNHYGTKEFDSGCTFETVVHTDASKAKAELAALTFDETDVTENVSRALDYEPAYNYGATIDWTVVSGPASIENKTLVFNEFPTSGTVEVVVKVTVTVNGTSEEKEFKLDVGQSDSVTATLTFDDAAKRTASSTSQQVWEENGITLIYDKAAYSNNLAEYANPVRFYKGTALTISYPGMTEIVFNCSTADYATVLGNSIDGATVDGQKVTIVFDQSKDEFKIDALSAQTRVNSLTVSGKAMDWADKQDAIDKKLTNDLLTGSYTATDTVTVPVAVAGVAITWTETSDFVAINATTGVVTFTQPEASDGDASVTVTASYVNEETGLPVEKPYTFTVEAKEVVNPDPGEGEGGDTPVVSVLATFNLGANGSASHSDGGNSQTSYSETVDGYTLSITGGTNMYTGARDLTGQSCIKFGTSSKTGSMTFTVPENVTEVVLYVAKYKANTSKISVNGTAYTLAKNSNDGLYDEIVVDTTKTKTITFATVSGGVRAMMNTIVFKGIVG